MQNLKSLKLFNDSKKRELLFNILNKNFATWLNNQLPYKINLKNKKYGEIYMAPLNPDSPEDFEEFKSIVIHPYVAIHSSWMHSLIGTENLEKILKSSNPAQDLNDVFTKKEYVDHLKEVYNDLTKYNQKYHLGYCTAYNKYQKLIGGGGVVPTKIKNDKVDTCDISLHVFPDNQKGGIGTDMMRAMLIHALDGYDVSKIKGSSLIKHIGTPLVCAQFGFKIWNGEVYKNYYLDRYMWNATKNLDNSTLEQDMASEIFEKHSIKNQIQMDNIQDKSQSNLQDANTSNLGKNLVTRGNVEDISKKTTPDNRLEIKF